MPESNNIAGYDVSTYYSSVHFRDEYTGILEKLSPEDAMALGYRLIASAKKSMEFTLTNHDRLAKEKAQDAIQNRGTRWA